MRRTYRLFILTLMILAFLWPTRFSSAQNPTPTAATSSTSPTATANGPTYIVQSGDTLWLIAQRFGVSLAALETINSITNPDQLQGGMALTIPGLQGIQGKLVTLTVGYGETMSSLSRKYGISPDMLKRLNHLTSPAELYAGYILVLPESSATSPAAGHVLLSPGQSLLELSALYNINIWTLERANALGQTWASLPGEALLLPGQPAKGPGALPPEITEVQIKPLPSRQGKETIIRLIAPTGSSFGGSFLDHALHFFADKDDSYVALQGIHAMAEPGLYSLTLTGTLKIGSTFAFSQMVNVGAADYPYDDPLTVNPETIDPAVTKPEDTEWAALASPVTPQKLWDGKFKMITPLSLDYCLQTGDCWSSRYGNRRSYNGSTYSYFHSGVDVVGANGSDIYAAAAGVVVFAGPLTVRGNATMINHGWGVYTAYLHQSEMLVKVGDRVEAGQLIGRIGSTGRVEGPHLHWEVWVGGIQVDPVDWLSQEYP